MTFTPDDFAEKLTRLAAELSVVLSEGLAANLPRAMTDVTAVEFARIAESIGKHIDAARLAAAGELDDRSRPELGDARLCAQRGCASATELLGRATGVALATAKDRIRIARLVATTTALSGDTMPARFPAIRVALDEGEIGLDTVSAITRSLGPIVDRSNPIDLAAAESALIDAATGRGPDDAPPCGADDTRIQAKLWALALDPDGTLPEYERALRRRSLTLGREREGLVPIAGAILPDVAAQLRRLFDAHLSPRVEDRTAGGPVFAPSDETAVLDERTRTQRHHDALAAILGVAARAADTPLLGGAFPTLLVTITATELERADGVGFADGTDTMVPALIARQIACCGGIQRLVLSDDGSIVELGSPRRVFTAAQRRAITARDGGCVIPGCHTPAAWCEIHHVLEHARRGPTHTGNGVMLCWYHHRTLETNGWAVRMIDGAPQTRAPAWLDPTMAWRHAEGSVVVQHERLRRRIASG